jgi:hypothetical protein
MKTRLILIVSVALLAVAGGCKKNTVATQWQEVKAEEARRDRIARYERQTAIFEKSGMGSWGVHDGGISRNYLDWYGKTYERVGNLRGENASSDILSEVFNGLYTEVEIRKGDPSDPLKVPTEPYSKRINDVKYQIRDDGVMVVAEKQ